MNDVVILGAGGFLGRALVDVLIRDSVPVRLLVRQPPSLDAPTAAVVVGDARDGAALRAAITPGSTVVNLVTSVPQPNSGSAIAAIAEACLDVGAGRVVHCSTATVAGRSDETIIDETSPCRPWTPYERAKLAEEEELRARIGGRIPICIARPTVVFGPGGLNLLSLARALRSGSSLTNRARSLLYGSRRMHLIPVHNAAAALAFLALRPALAPEQTFLVSEDDAPGNDFVHVESVLREGLGASRPPSRGQLPRVLLALALRLRGRSDTNPARFYDPSRLRDAGFVRPTTLTAGLAEFAAWFLEAHPK